jgi:hypothetical protein
MHRQQHHHRPGGLPPPAVQVGFELLDLAAWTVVGTGAQSPETVVITLHYVNNRNGVKDFDV